jgi:hypothetical protein
VGAGQTTITASQAGNSNYDPAPDATQMLTINRKAVVVIANGRVKVKGSADPALTYSASGLVGTDTLSGGLARNAGETPGIYTITQGTVTDANNPNYAITFTSANFVIRGPIAVNDPGITRTPNSPSTNIPVATLLANDTRIDANGSSQTDNLSITAVTSGTGNSVSLSGEFVVYTPDTPSDSAPLTFTYTLTDAASGTTDTGMVTVTTVAPVPYPMDIVQVGVATYSSGNDTTSITMGFNSVPNQNLLVEYSTDLNTWAPYASNPVFTGATGSFAVTVTAPGNQVTLWNAAMFFRATR